MGCKRKIFWAKTAVIFSTLPLLIYAYEFGPDPGNAGVPGESNCTACHTGTALNGGPGSITVTFSGGQSYAAGAKQHVTVTAADPNQRRTGFQMTARLASDPKTQAGSFSNPDGTTQVLCSAAPFAAQQPAPCPANLPLQYIEHTLQGYQAGKPTYEFDWTAPATSVGPITFYVAMNAANGDGTNRGDRIYTTTVTLTPAAEPAPGGNLPAISGVVNGASFTSGISAGSWVTVQGTNLATSTRTWRADEIVNGNLPMSLDGVSVKINGKDAAVYFISPTQINVQAPSDTAQGAVQVTVTNSAGTSTAATAQLQSFSPAFFLWDGKYAVATRPDFTWVGKPGLFPGTTTTPAKPGDVIVLWGTGFGSTNPEMPAGKAVDRTAVLANNPSVRVGGTGADFLGGALTPGAAGLYQIVVKIPDSAPDGDVPVVAEFGSFRSPDNVFITVQR